MGIILFTTIPNPLVNGTHLLEKVPEPERGLRDKCFLAGKNENLLDTSVRKGRRQARSKWK
jgi:hypothetical protein